MSKITNFSKDFWRTVAECKGSPAEPEILRNYDLVSDRKKGLTCGQLAIKYNITCTQIMRILKRYEID